VEVKKEMGLIGPDDQLTWEKHGYKIQNTRLFSMYLKKIKEMALSIKAGRVVPSQLMRAHCR
jgi:hypothetical protein